MLYYSYLIYEMPPRHVHRPGDPGAGAADPGAERHEGDPLQRQACQVCQDTGRGAHPPPAGGEDWLLIIFGSFFFLDF